MLKCSYPDCKEEGEVVSEKDPTPLCKKHSAELSLLIDHGDMNKIIKYMVKVAFNRN